MKSFTLSIISLLLTGITMAQVKVDLKKFNPKNEASVSQKAGVLEVKWPAGNGNTGKIVFDLTTSKPLFKLISISKGAAQKIISTDIDPAFVLSIGKRDLLSQNGWNIFFDKVPSKPYKSYPAVLKKSSASVKSVGSHTVVTIGNLHADRFDGALEVTFYNGSPLFNVAAVMSTDVDATAVVYDAGLVDRKSGWKNIMWINADDEILTDEIRPADTAMNVAVKHRAIAVRGDAGTLALFPAPHQYFYPLDEAFNLKFTWHGNNYRKMVDGYGIGIRQDLKGDNRFVPWFNAPPGSKQRMNFFCLLSGEGPSDAFTAVKKFTHNDSYVKLPGFKTMSSHFHNEFIMSVVLAGKPVPEHPEFVDVFKKAGIDIVHLAEFHYTAHPKGPDDQRLKELKALFEMCGRLSDKDFLLLPGEEPNEFFGGHWLQLFPKPVYWIMSRNKEVPFVEDRPGFGKVYHIGDKNDMLKLLEQEKGLAWTAHARTKGSVNAPDVYAHEDFFLSDRFMGAAWKAMPADLSQPFLGNNRVLGLLDDMNNWGLKKTVITEADLFTITPQNEMYAHLNVNYLMLDKAPKFSDSWQPVLDVMQQGKFFGSTGEVLMPELKINGKISGETLALNADGTANVSLKLLWTFPMNYIEVISGDGTRVYRDKVDLTKTKAYGDQVFQFKTKLAGRKWARVEAWDVAANGAFSQTFYIK